ncbi:hypothetical protein YC2023_098830 [Brassica napus]
MSCFVVEMFAGLKMFRGVARELGPRGRVNLSMGRSVFLHSALCGFPRSISCIFRMFRIALGALL